MGLSLSRRAAATVRTVNDGHDGQLQQRLQGRLQREQLWESSAGEHSGRAACPHWEGGSCNVQLLQACAVPGEQRGARPRTQELHSLPVTPALTAWSRCGTCGERAAMSEVRGDPPHSSRRPCMPIPPQVQLHAQRLPLQEHLGAQLGLLGKDGAEPQPCSAAAARLLLPRHGPASP